jgi:hypothetical protein
LFSEVDNSDTRYAEGVFEEEIEEEEDEDEDEDVDDGGGVSLVGN